MTKEPKEPKVITNGHRREIYQRYNQDGDYIDDCFRYKGEVYSLDDFMSVHNPVYTPNPPNWLRQWDGYMNDSFYSGILVRYAIDEWGDVDTDQVIVGWFYS